MSDPLDRASERMTAAISDSIRAGEIGEGVGMPAGWVLVATYHDEDGDLHTCFLTSNDARQHETLGLLALGQTVWQEEARRWVLGDPDD